MRIVCGTRSHERPLETMVAMLLRLYNLSNTCHVPGFESGALRTIESCTSPILCPMRSSSGGQASEHLLHYHSVPCSLVRSRPATSDDHLTRIKPTICWLIGNIPAVDHAGKKHHPSGPPADYSGTGGCSDVSLKIVRAGWTQKE